MNPKCTCPDSHARLYEMCPLHKAAPKMFKALKAIIALADEGAFLDLADIETTPVSRQARAAIKAASS